MPLHQVIVLAIVQGLTEFLPVSSTAHLALIPWLLHWNDPGLTFDVALHVGTLVAVLIYFFRTWADLLLLGFGARALPDSSAERADLESNRWLLWFLAVGTIPAGIAGWIFHDQAESSWRNPLIIAGALIVVAIIMAVGERISRQEHVLASIGLEDSLWVGIAQAFAIIPGVSRSGVTMTAGLLRDMNRETAARFSFLLSTPVIAGAALKELMGFRHQGIPSGMHSPFLLGALVSAIVGYATIGVFLKYLQFGTFKIFIYYRIVLGIIIIALAFFFQLKTGF